MVDISIASPLERDAGRSKPLEEALTSGPLVRSYSHGWALNSSVSQFPNGALGCTCCVVFWSVLISKSVIVYAALIPPVLRSTQHIQADEQNSFSCD